MSTKLPAQETILLVDDNPTNLGVLFDFLSDSGFRLLVAEDGESALERAGYAKPNIILLDVMMPKMDGFETCARLKANAVTQNIPVIFMTALAETADKVKGLSVGGVDYVTKPIQPDEVLARVKTHLAIQKLQNQLAHNNEMLQKEIGDRQKAESAMRLLLHAVSHDLRNPVTGMLMVVQNLLNAQVPAVEPQRIAGPNGETPNGGPGINNRPAQGHGADRVSVPRAILERMVQGGERQLNLINSLIEAHALDTQGIALNRQPLDLNQLVPGIVQDLQPLCTKNRATLRDRISADLPSVDADANQLWRVFENFIANAIKHNPPGVEIIIDAQIDVQTEGSQMRCTIQDNGVGIAPDLHERLFELYARGNQAGKTQGLGIGLYVCQQIIAAHGGKIGIQSTLGEGATFWFTLPLAVDGAPHPPSELNRPQSTWN